MVRYITAAVFGVMGLWIAIGNWEIIIRWYVKKTHGSIIPVIGGIFLSIALRLIFSDEKKWLCLIGSAIDFGSLPWLASFPFAVKDLTKKVKKGVISRKDAAISLCCYGVCMIIMIISLCVCIMI